MEPNQVTTQQFKQILEYVKGELLKQVAPMIYIYAENQYPTEAVAKTTVLCIPQLITLDGYLKSQGEKKQKVKPVVSEVYKEAWKKFWNIWPSTKSVPGTEFKYGAKMKSDELKMYGKWVTAIESGKISIEMMYKAADSYLQWGYEDSKRNGRNELQYRNGLEPWLNQESYLTYMDVPVPKKVIEKVTVYENSTDQ